MIIISSDDKRFVDVGSEGIWYSVLSTADVRLIPIKKDIRLALEFLRTGECDAKNAHETARQFNLLRDAFSQIAPFHAVYDMDNPSLQAPWSRNLSDIVTSCGNLYTTSDGKDLLYEIVCILAYAHYKKVNVLSQGWSKR